MRKLLTSGQLSMRPGWPSEWTLARWRHEKIGPAYIRIGGRLVYDLADIEAWEESHRSVGNEMPAQKKKGPKPKTAERRRKPPSKAIEMGDLFDGQ